MSGYCDTGRPGCHGKLCRAAHFSLRKLPVIRYPADDAGLTASDGYTGWICGIVSFASQSVSGKLRVPGTTGGQRPVHLVVAAGSLEPAVLAGDLISVDNKEWTAVSVSVGDHLTAELVPSEEEGE